MLLLPNIKNEQILLEDYTYLLSAAGISDFHLEGGYLQVGRPSTAQPWILHLSVVLPQLEELLEVVVPLLVQQRCMFMIPQNPHVASSIIDGNYSHQSYARVVSIRVAAEAHLEPLACELRRLTSSFIGPSIHSAYPLGGIVYLSFEPIIRDQTHQQAQEIIGTVLPVIKYDLRLPNGIHWPFTSIPEPVDRPDMCWLSDFLILETVKSDLKSRVLFARRISWKKFYQPVLIKEGYANTVYDAYGRSIHDRLGAQGRLLKILSEGNLAPRPLGLYPSDKGTCLVVEKVPGRSFYQIIKEIHGRGMIWLAMAHSDQEELLDQVIAVLVAVGRMHQLGVIHRDLTPSNILHATKGGVRFIDLELGFYTKTSTPDPVFTLGSPGFMSDEQVAGVTPTVGEDIYALGGTIIMSLTGLWPTTLDRALADKQETLLNFLLRDHRLVDVLMDCRAKESALRPTVLRIESAVRSYKKRLAKLPGMDAINTAFDLSAIEKLATRIAGVISIHVYQELSGNRESVNRSFSSGITGMVYALEHAHSSGLNIHDYDVTRGLHLRHLQEGSHNMIAHLQKDATQCWDPLLVSLIEQYITPLVSGEVFEENTSHIGPEMAGGLAGIALNMLWVTETLPANEREQIEPACLKSLLAAQQRDGSWITRSRDGQRLKFTGIASGTAGIILCLLKYYQLNKTDALRAAITNGLSWLRVFSKAPPVPIAGGRQIVSPWLTEGFTGVAAAFLAADVVIPGEDYLQTAQSLLSDHPSLLAGNFLGYNNGVAGIGLLCIEMFRHDHDQQWLKKAEWIATLLNQLSVIPPNQCSLAWIADKQDGSDMGFTHGNGGILFFLTNLINLIRHGAHNSGK